MSSYPPKSPRFLSLPQVIQITGLSRSTIYRRIGADDFPKPLATGTSPKARRIVWAAHDVEAWMADRPPALGARRSQRGFALDGLLAVLVFGLCAVFGAIVGLYVSDMRSTRNGQEPRIVNAVAYRAAVVMIMCVPSKARAERLAVAQNDWAIIRPEVERLRVWPIQVAHTSLSARWIRGAVVGGGVGALAPIALLVLWQLIQLAIGGLQVAERTLRPGHALWLGGLRIEPRLIARNFLATGAMGCGKSTVLKTLARHARALRQTALVVDFQGEIFARYFRNGVDVLLAPYDRRSVVYSPLAEIRTDADCKRVANALVPITGSTGEDRKWVGRGRLFVASCLRICWRQHKAGKAMTNRTFLNILNEAGADFFREQLPPDDRLRSALAHDAGRYLESVRAVAAFAAQSLDGLPPDAGFDAFSVRRFVRASQKKSGAWLYCVVNERNSDEGFALASFVSAMTVSAKLESGESSSRLWLILDEFGQYPPQEAFLKAVSTGRKFGLVTAAAFQNIGQLESAWGRDQTSDLIEGFGTKCLFRSGEPTHLKWLVSLVGTDMKESTSKSESWSTGASASRSESVQTSARIEDVAPTALFSRLPDYTCLVLQPGASQYRRLRIPFVSLGSPRYSVFEPREDECEPVAPSDPQSACTPDSDESADWIDPDEIAASTGRPPDGPPHTADPS